MTFLNLKKALVKVKEEVIQIVEKTCLEFQMSLQIYLLYVFPCFPKQAGFMSQIESAQLRKIKLPKFMLPHIISEKIELLIGLLNVIDGVPK